MTFSRYHMGRVRPIAPNPVVVNAMPLTRDRVKRRVRYHPGLPMHRLPIP